jgi:hypothetical protein
VEITKRVLTDRNSFRILVELFAVFVKPFCWTGRTCSLTTDTMCQNPFETIRLSSPNGLS